MKAHISPASFSLNHSKSIFERHNQSLVDMPDGIVIKSLEASSIPDLADFQARVFGNLDSDRKNFVAPRDSAHRQKVIDNGGSLYAAIDINTGEIIASSIGCYINDRKSLLQYMASDLLAGEFAYADFPQLITTTLLVDPSYWGRHICRNMFKAAYKDAVRRNLAAASLCVSTDNMAGLMSAFHAGYNLIGYAHHTQIDHPVFLFTQEKHPAAELVQPILVKLDNQIGWLELQNYLDAGYCGIEYDPRTKIMALVPYVKTAAQLLWQA